MTGVRDGWSWIRIGLHRSAHVFPVSACQGRWMRTRMEENKAAVGMALSSAGRDLRVVRSMKSHCVRPTPWLNDE